MADLSLLPMSGFVAWREAAEGLTCLRGSEHSKAVIGTLLVLLLLLHPVFGHMSYCHCAKERNLP